MSKTGFQLQNKLFLDDDHHLPFSLVFQFDTLVYPCVDKESIFLLGTNKNLIDFAVANRTGVTLTY